VVTNLDEFSKYEFKDYIVKKNTKVDPRAQGGWKGEIDIVAYHPQTENLIHIETSMQVTTWANREIIFTRKFQIGREYIPQIFPWIETTTNIEQWAVIPAADTNHPTIGGGKVVPAWKLRQQITNDVREIGPWQHNAIPEQFPLLRTIQFTVNWGHEAIKIRTA